MLKKKIWHRFISANWVVG